jgi:hypothetical protein
MRTWPLGVVVGIMIATFGSSPVAADTGKLVLRADVLATHSVQLGPVAQSVPANCASMRGLWGKGTWSNNRNAAELWVTHVTEQCDVQAILFEGKVGSEIARKSLTGKVAKDQMILNLGKRRITFILDKSKYLQGDSVVIESDGKAQWPNSVRLELMRPPEQQLLDGGAAIPWNLAIATDQVATNCRDVRGVWTGSFGGGQPAAAFVEKVELRNGVCEVILVYSVGAFPRAGLQASWLRVPGILNGSVLEAKVPIFGEKVSYRFDDDKKATLRWKDATANLKLIPTDSMKVSSVKF